MDWTKASGDTMVCESGDLTLRDVVRAIALNDADTVEMVKTLTGKSENCGEENCDATIQEILDIYVPVYSALKNGCGGGGCAGCSGSCG